MIDGLLNELSELPRPALVQYVLTQTPALFDLLSRHVPRARAPPRTRTLAR